MATIEINGITIGYNDEGDGSPLVLIHGHPFDKSMWSPQFKEFAGSRWRLLAPDLRGYGISSVVPGKTLLRTFAEDIASFLDAMELDRVILGGLSMGGQIVMEFCRLFPDRVLGLVLADTFAAAETPEGKQIRNDTADRLLREGMAGYAEEVLDKMVAPRTIEARPTVAEHVRRMMRDTPAAGAAAALRGRAERPDYRKLLTQITVPSLIVVGQNDEYTPVADALDMHERVKGSTLAIIQGAAHMPNLEQPEAFNAALCEFLNNLDNDETGDSTTES
ncbi:alpha/beta fold hydrolase [Streptomyces bobili]|uniref:alpha/beta fold hydrolase n=1 Tax=Streptomyces bobili TaxID=67280 RepID=UPI0037F87736